MKRSRRQTIRRIVQGAFLLLFASAPLLNAAGVTWLLATGSSLRLGTFELLEPASATAAALAARGATAELLLHAAPFALLLTLAGSVFCGWACPWGLFSELLDRLRPSASRRRWPEGGMRRARAARGIALGLVFGGGAVSAIPLGALLAGPRIATSIGLELSVLQTIGSTTALLLFALLGIELFAPRRIWCRALCPVGGVASLLRGRWTARVTRRLEGGCTCRGVPACQTLCPWGLDPRQAGWSDGCTTCLVCVDACPARNLQVGLRRARP